MKMPLKVPLIFEKLVKQDISKEFATLLMNLTTCWIYSPRLILDIQSNYIEFLVARTAPPIKKVDLPFKF